MRSAGGVAVGVLQVAHVPRPAARRLRSGDVPNSTPRSPTSIGPPTACTARRGSWPTLRADGRRVSRKTVAASLRRQRLAGICPRRFAPATTVVDLDAPVPKDLVGRRFDTGELDRVWTSDITYLRTGQGWLYLCAVRDGCSRRVIGWAIDEHLRTDLVEAALSMAVAMRGELAQEVILHADYAEVCVKPRICGDGLRRGSCWGFLGLTFRCYRRL